MIGSSHRLDVPKQGDRFLIPIPIWAIGIRGTPGGTCYCRTPITKGSTAFPLFTVTEFAKTAALQFPDHSSQGAIEPVAIDSLQSLAQILTELESAGTRTVVVDPSPGLQGSGKIYTIRQFIENVELQLPPDEPDEDPVRDNP